MSTADELIDKLPPLLSDAYDVTADGPRTKLFQLADARTANGEDYADALFAIARERPELVELSDAWCYALATGDAGGLPRWLRPKFSRVMARQQDSVQDAATAGGVPDPAAKFNEAVEARAAELQAGGLSRLDALKQSQNELYSKYADVLE